MSEADIKKVLNQVPYGFYLLTSHHGNDANAMVFNWFSQVSFTPRQVAVGFKKINYSYDLVKESGVFAINLIHTEDQDVIKKFTKGRAVNPDKMVDAVYSAAPITGCPIIEGASAFLECNVVDFVDSGGDHYILVGEVVGAGVIKEGDVNDTLTLPDLGWSYAG